MPTATPSYPSQPTSLTTVWYWPTKMIVEGQADKAIELIDKELAGLDNQESLVYLLYNLSQAYAQKGDTENKSITWHKPP